MLELTYFHTPWTKHNANPFLKNEFPFQQFSKPMADLEAVNTVVAMTTQI